MSNEKTTAERLREYAAWADRNPEVAREVLMVSLGSEPTHDFGKTGMSAMLDNWPKDLAVEGHDESSAARGWGWGWAVVDGVTVYDRMPIPQHLLNARREAKRAAKIAEARALLASVDGSQS